VDVSDEIVHDGDAIAAKVPALNNFRDQIAEFDQVLSDLATTDFVKGARDAQTQNAQSTFTSIMGDVIEIFQSLGGAIGLQGDRFKVVHDLGTVTEDAAKSQTDGMSGHH
jgi:hypothetical protein